MKIGLTEARIQVIIINYSKLLLLHMTMCLPRMCHPPFSLCFNQLKRRDTFVTQKGCTKVM